MKISLSLMKTLIIEDINNRYKSSILGLAWSFITPLLQLALFTFVFGVVLKTKWNMYNQNETIFDFSIFLFTGLVIFQFFADVLTKSTGLMFQYEYMVKKVLFPIKILPLVLIASSLFHTLIAIIGIILILLIQGRPISISILYIPYVLLTMLPISIGISYLLSSLGVYIRDLSHIMVAIVPGLLFLSPIFYSLQALPDWLQPLMFFNPVVYPVEELRNVILFSKTPDFFLAFVNIIYGFFILIIGNYIFRKSQRGFADVM